MKPDFMHPDNGNMKPSFRVSKAVISYTLRHGDVVQEAFEEVRKTIVEYQDEAVLGRKRVVREVDEPRVPIGEIVSGRLEQHRKLVNDRVADTNEAEFPVGEVVRTRVTYTSSIASPPKTVDYKEPWQESRGGFRT
jgi:hypothetical protein